ncbi:hypothetical protein SAMN05216371_8210 [Streptomyces sp. TLI_053]|uniref:hypothetical protein n=1 Tax=Streptomyces sp. TLI_053 TaxID=1855352 RepID=UPI00087B9CA4|nr:hypothetical protein [Streptomyces sp. TLI_053]SDT83387.1 hypothetical protein SAMN05216371_8210 [Streptomyces sp. TLI_053]
MTTPDPADGPLQTTGIPAGPGGVMTTEVGVITGDLTLRTVWDGCQALFTVQYDGADEWYTVEGSPVPAPTAAVADAAHRAMTAAVRRGGAATVADVGR